MSMTLKDLRDWINQLPTEFDNFGLVNGERGMYNEEYSYRVDKPIVTLDIDEETKEVIFLHQNRDEWKNHIKDIPRESITSKEAEEELEALIEEDIADEEMKKSCNEIELKRNHDEME